MDTKILYAVAVVSILSVVSLTKGDVDCNEHPSFVHPKECCPVPNLISEEVMNKCREQLSVPPPPLEQEAGGDEDEDGPPGRHKHRHGPHGHHGRHHHCFESCLLNETKILNDGQLDEDILDTYLNEAVGDTPDIIPVLKESFQVCYEKSNEIMTKMREHFENEENGPPRRGRGPPQGHCSPQGGIMLHCTLMETFKNCPDSIWTGTDECNGLRDYFTECMKPPEEDDEV